MLMEEEKAVQKTSTSGSSSTKEDKGIIHSFSMGNKSLFTKSTLSIFLIVTVLGIVTGYIFSNQGTAQTNKTSTDTNVASQVNEKIYGTADEKTFKDQATGVLKSGGIEGEGARDSDAGAN